MLAGALGGALAVEAIVDVEVVGVIVVVAGASGAESGPFKTGGVPGPPGSLRTRPSGARDRRRSSRG